MHRHPKLKGKIWQEGVTVEYLGGSRIKFTCPAGHVTSETLTTGPHGFKRPMDPGMVAKLARYWSDRVTYRCKKCNGGPL
jgi:hypothetical protein